MDIQARVHYRQISRNTNEQLPGILSGVELEEVIPSGSDVSPLLEQVELEGQEILQSAVEEIPMEDKSPVAREQSSASIREAAPSVEFTYYLYYLKFRGKRSNLVRVSRTMTQNLNLQRILEELKKGPHIREKGLLNAFDDNIEIRSVRYDSRTGLVVIDVNDSIDRMGERIVRDRMDQLLFTVNQFPEVRGIRLLINGKPVSSLSGGAIHLPEVITKSDRKVLDYEG